METKYFTVGQNVYVLKDNEGNSQLVCIAVEKGIAEIIAAMLNGTTKTELGSIPDEQLHSNG